MNDCRLDNYLNVFGDLKDEIKKLGGLYVSNLKKI